MSERTVPPAHAPIAPARGIGVFICACGGAISRRIDIDRLRAVASADPNVRDVICFERGCEGSAMDEIMLSLKAGDIDRFVLAGCSARSASERFVKLAEDSGVCPDLVLFSDLLDLCAVHSKAAAQSKAERMLRTSLKRCSMLQATPRVEVDRSQRVLVVGNGPSAITASRCLLDEGLSVIVINPSSQLEESDHLSVIPLEGGALEQMAKAAGDRFRVLDSAEVVAFAGHPGRFTLTFTQQGERQKETAGGVIVALDRVETEGPQRARFPGSITQEMFESKLKALEKLPRDIVMVAMDEEGEAERSPISTHDAVHHSMHAKGLSPSSRVTVIAREVYAFGQCEVGYRKAQEMGVRFIRSEKVPTFVQGGLVVNDVHSGEDIRVPADLIVVDNHTECVWADQVARVFSLPIVSDGSMARANPKCRPAATHIPGVFLCGSASEMNLGAGPTMSAKTAASRAAALLRSRIVVGGNVAEVDQERCSSCLTCVRICPFHAPSIGQEGKAEVDIGLCQGCGMCAAACPSKAIQVYSFRDDQLLGELSAAMEDDDQ